MSFFLLMLSDFIEVPLLTLLELFCFSAWISLVLIIPDRYATRIVLASCSACKPQSTVDWRASC